MKKITALLPIFCFLLISLLVINSCNKDDITNSTGSGNSIWTTISGKVTDEYNTPLIGATVTAYGKTTTTNQYGVFLLQKVYADNSRCLVKISKAGFFNRTHAFIASANTINYINIILISDVYPNYFNASSGATISINGGSVQFQPNSLVTSAGNAYSGGVYITLRHLSQNNSTFGFAIPGGDLAGKDANNNDVVLYSYGMLGVELKGISGELLNLSNGSTATITMTIPSSQTATAPATIPLWYFDEISSLWKEEGQATKTGNEYVGTVAHFSWWNCDYPGPVAIIKGKVVDCLGNPVPNINVTVLGWCNITTDQNGEYQDYLPAGMTFEIQVLSSNNSGIIIDSQLENIPILTNGQVFTVPDLVIPCPSRVAGNLKTCSGENASGFVFISSATFSNYLFTSTGAFSLPVLPNTDLTINCYNNIYTATCRLDITSLPAGITLNLPDQHLCSAVIVENVLNITNCSLVPDTVINIYPTPLSSATVNQAITIVNLNIGLDKDFSVYIQGTSSGTYNWSGTSTTNYIYCGLGDSTWLQTSGSNGTITITVGNVGGFISGEYDGTARFYKNNQNAIAHINGRFKYIRSQ